MSDRGRAAAPVLIAVAALAPLLITLSPEWPSLNGDEPHYVVLAESLLRDGDLQLAGDYTDGRLGWLAPSRLTPHVKPGARPETGYSFHGAGLAWLLAPLLAIDPRPPAGMRLMGVLCSFLIGLSLWRTVRAIDPRLPALAIALLGQLSAPILFNVPHLFPDLPAAAISLGVWTLAARRRSTLPAAVVAGAGLALLPWMHFKFLLLWAVLLSWLVLRWRSGPAGTTRLIVAGALALAGPASLCLWNVHAFGSASPTAAASYPEAIAAYPSPLLAYLADPLGAMRTGVGLLLDQKDGLLAWAPHFILAAAGAGWLWVRRRVDAVGMLLVVGSVWLPTALSQNTGLWGPPGRWLLSVAWVPTLLAGIGLTFPAAGPALSRARGALLAATAVVTGLLLQHPALLYVDRTDTRSPLLQALGGPGLPLWNGFPVWTRYVEPAWPMTIAWLAATAAVAVWLWHRGAQAADAAPGDETPRRAAVSAPAFAIAAALMVGAVLLVGHVAPIGGPEVVRTVAYAGTEVHVATRPAARAWPHPTTIWFGGEDEVTVWVSTPRPPTSIEVELLAPTDQSGSVRLGDAIESFTMRRDEVRRLRLAPSSARLWNGRAWLPLVVRTEAGVLGREFSGVATDERWLGINVGIVDLRFAPEADRRE